MNTRPSLLFYCQHSRGIGHLVRSLALAAGLAERFQVVLLNGGPLPKGPKVPVGIKLIDLPPLGFDTNMQLVSRDHRCDLERAQQLRQKIILEVFHSLRPNVLLIELFPFGRKKFANELLPLLEEARIAHRPRPVVACSLRDILVGQRRDQQRHDDRAAEVANRFFDAILVHSDAKFARLEESFHPQTALRVPVCHTGFVSRDQKNSVAPRPARESRVIVSAGGGLTNAEPLLRTAIEAYQLLRQAEDIEMKVITGPFLPAEAWNALSALSPTEKGLSLRRFVPDLLAELRTASASVSQCGYNTALDILRSGVPALVVPFEQGNDDEQMNRARRLERMGALRVLEQKNLSAQRLTEEIRALLQFKPQALQLDLNGAQYSVRILERLVPETRVGKTRFSPLITTLQGLLLSATTRRVLRDQLKALLPAPNMLGPCRLRHARFRPGRKLKAYYDARVRVEGTERYRIRPMVVTWRLDGKADWLKGRDALTEMQAEALRQGVAAPFRQLTAELPEWGMHIQVSPLDAQFPQLVRLLDPRHVRDMLAPAHAASGVASDQPQPDRYAVSSIRYLPSSCHVLRYDSLDAAKGGAVFAKLYTGEEGAHAFHVARGVADWLAEHGESVAAVRPLAYVVEDKGVLYPGLSGAPLSKHLRRPRPGVAGGLERAGAALHALHRLPQAVAGPLQPHDFTAAARMAVRASDHIPALLPSVGAAIDALLDRTREGHERLPQEPPTFTHRDFKSTHVWITPGGQTLIDFDSSDLADPAQDVGNFLADLQLRYAAHNQPGLEHAQERFLAGYAPGAPEERLVRARLYEVVELVKMTRHLRPFNRDWASRTEQLIRRAQAVLNDLELTLGLPATQPSLPGFLEGARG